MKALNYICSLAVFLFIYMLMFSCSDDSQNSVKTDFDVAQAQAYYARRNSDIKLVNFDRATPEPAGKELEIQPLWSSSKTVCREGKTMIEVPVLQEYEMVIVAGKRKGRYIRPFKQKVDCRLLFTQKEETGEISCRMLTLVGHNIGRTHAGCLENLTGYAVFSDLSGKTEKAYLVKNKELKEIIAGNAELQYQEKECFCFCFCKTNHTAVKTKSSEDTTEIWSEETYCIYCLNPLEYCTCERCPECYNTFEQCTCRDCFRCGLPKNECGCKTICTGCGKPAWECDCFSSTPPVSTFPCPMCGEIHEGECVSSPVSPGVLCKYGNIYCLGGENCLCCPSCHNYPCNCSPWSTQ